MSAPPEDNPQTPHRDDGKLPNPLQPKVYAQKLAELFARSAKGIRWDLEPMYAALGHLPMHRWPPTVLVGGTNGKGSVARLLAGCLSAAGYRCGLYTSPHLLRFAERIQIDGQMLDDATSMEHVRKIESWEAKLPRSLTFFETTTVMAAQAFLDAHADVVIAEVGLGGRLDATNALPHQGAVITPIGLDHQAYLGPTVAHIAREKAGIVPKNGWLVMAQQTPEVTGILHAQAERQNAWVSTAQPDFFPSLLPKFPLKQQAYWGWTHKHNQSTAAAAILGLQHMGFSIDAEAQKQALSAAPALGRYGWHALPHSPVPMLVDGAHNPPGAQALARSIAEDPKLVDRPMHAVVSMLGDRDFDAWIAPLWDRMASWTGFANSSPRSMPFSWWQTWPHGHAATDAKAAIAHAQAQAEKDGGIVLVCGSLFGVADVFADILGQHKDPAVDG